MVAADFNGDGILDLAVEGFNQSGFAVFIFLGKGDGTFHRPRQITKFSGICGFGLPLLVDDFNHDGKADIAFCRTDGNLGRIGILLGNGDGTFKKPFYYRVLNSIFTFSFAAGDFNSDGNTDLVASYLISDSQAEFALFLGNGDGTFQQKKLVKLPGGQYEGLGIVPGDFNSDGLLDFMIQIGAVDVFIQK
jgi:VCBS repeat protein